MDIPVLTVAEHNLLRSLEAELRGHLGKCVSGYSVRDKDAAFEYARTYAVRFYDFYYLKYSRHSDQASRPQWRPASEGSAYDRVVACLNNFSAYEVFLLSDNRRERLRKTISDYAEAQVVSQQIKPLAAYQDYSPPLLGMVLHPPVPPAITAQMEEVETPTKALDQSGLAIELRRLLEEARFTNEQIAEEAGIDWRTVYRHLSGQVRPTKQTRWAYEQAFSKRLKRTIKLPSK